jgi:hypothetical protein
MKDITVCQPKKEKIEESPGEPLDFFREDVVTRRCRRENLHSPCKYCFINPPKQKDDEHPPQTKS